MLSPGPDPAQPSLLHTRRTPRAAPRLGVALREGCGSARPAPFASLSAPVVLCCAQGQPSRTEGRSNEERGTKGYRNEERGTEERGTALLHGLAPSRARARRRGSFSRLCIGAMRTVRSCGLRLDAGIGPRVRYTLYGGSIDRITALLGSIYRITRKLHFTRVCLPDYL